MKTVRDYYTTVEDFPEKGIQYRDVTTVLDDPEGLKLAIDEMMALIVADAVDAIIGIESRGFMFATPIAYLLHKPFVPIRKAGKLPRETVSVSYALEYGEATIELHKDALKPGARVVIIDDLIATGGTAQAAARLVEKVGGVVAGFVFLSELTYLDGRKNLSKYSVRSVVEF